MRQNKLKGSMIQRYQLKSKIGIGGHAVVYLAQDLQTQTEVAIKQLQFSEKMSSAEKNTLVQRFKQEYQIYQQLNHPNIVKLIGYIEEPPEYALVMEYIAGDPLDLYLQKSAISLADFLELLIQMTEGFHYAHQQKIIHRDIKPDNILVSANHQVKIMDFGVAKADASTATSQTVDGSLLGTLAYMSPEQLQNSGQVCRRSDIYSLGVLLYQVFTGQLPFAGENIAHLITRIFTEPLLPPHHLNSALNPAISALICQALCREPSDRYPSMLSLKIALRKLQRLLPSQELQKPLQELCPHLCQHSGEKSAPQVSLRLKAPQASKPTPIPFYARYVSEEVLQGETDELFEDLETGEPWNAPIQALSPPQPEPTSLEDEDNGFWTDFD